MINRFYILFWCFLAANFISLNANPNADCIKGNGKIVSQDRQIQDFSKIIFTCFGNLYIKQGNSNYIRVDVDENLINLINTDFRNNSLIIGTDGQICTRNLNVFITFKNIDGLNLKGSGDVFAKGAINLNQVQVLIEGNGSISFDNLMANDLQTIISGSGDINISGYGNNLLSIINGSGDLIMPNYQANSVKAVINGSGDIQTYCKERLDINIKGSGDVYYEGNPKFKFIYIHGSGDVFQKKR